jgi:hypothetical protein
MSWSFSAKGLPAEVLKQVRQQLTSYALEEPEQSLRQHASHQIETSLRSWPSDLEVFVNANGSQYQKGKNEDGNPGFVNSLQVLISGQAYTTISNDGLGQLMEEARAGGKAKKDLETTRGLLTEAEKQIADLDAEVKALKTPAPTPTPKVADSDGGTDKGEKTTA